MSKFRGGEKVRLTSGAWGLDNKSVDPQEVGIIDPSDCDDDDSVKILGFQNYPYGYWDEAVSIEIVELKSLREVEVGDVIHDPEDNKDMVVTDVEFKVETKDHGSFTLPYMEEQGFTVVEQSYTTELTYITELTLEQIAEKFELPVNQIRVKK